MADHFLGDGGRGDELVQVVARLDAHLMAEINEIFRRHVACRATVAAVRAAAHATDAGIELNRAEHERFVITGQRLATLVVQMHMEVGDLRPALTDGFDGFPDLMRQIPAHGLHEG